MTTGGQDDRQELREAYEAASLKHHVAALQACVAAGDVTGAYALLDDLGPDVLRPLAVLQAQGAVLLAALGAGDLESVASAARRAADTYQVQAIDLATQLHPDGA